MPEPQPESITALLRSLLDDARELIREEIALARAEIRDEITAAQTVGIAFASAALVGLIGATLLCVAVGGAVAYLLGWPAWAGYGIIAVLLLIAGYMLMNYGRKRLANVRALPKTTETLKENVAWMQNRSGMK
jgi:fructose-specific phosphotransferase system IIC component